MQTRIVITILLSFIYVLTYAQNVSLLKDSDPCDFQSFINNHKTPALAKNIYLDKEWSLENNNESLALLDSLTAKDKSSRPFYFKVVTKSEEKSDGYYSEALGSVGYNYILNNTQEFASYFDYNKCNTDKDLAIWADIVILELSIAEEGNYNKPIAEEFIKTLNSNCTSCSNSQKETIKNFGSVFKNKWIEVLKKQD